VSGPKIRVRTRQDLARQRRQRHHQCWNHLIAAPLWPMHGANLGTLLRTCDAVGACLADLPAARERTIAVLGHEQTGIPPEALDLLDVAVEIPMIGSGQSLNVAVAGSLVLYRLAGFL
jgi:tRNA (guanosine-2'-O-)-methyltransferase